MTQGDPVTQEDTVSIAAFRALEEAKGDIRLATEYLIKRVRTDRALKMAILEPLVEYACNNAISRQQRVNRERVWTAPTPRPNTSHSEQIQALARSNLMLFPLPMLNGKLLRDATRGDVILAGDFYAKQAADMAHKGRWLALVGQSIPDGKTVADVLSEDRLRELQKEAANV
jgi:hypothetical protein